MLVSELDRADIVGSNEVAPKVVTMNSTVRFVAKGEENVPVEVGVSAPGRRALKLRVVSVVDQPESKGHFHL